MIEGCPFWLRCTWPLICSGNVGHYLLWAVSLKQATTIGHFAHRLCLAVLIMLVTKWRDEDGMDCNCHQSLMKRQLFRRNGSSKSTQVSSTGEDSRPFVQRYSEQVAAAASRWRCSRLYYYSVVSGHYLTPALAEPNVGAHGHGHCANFDPERRV